MYIDDFFTNTVQVKFAKLCFIITLLGVYPFMPGLMTFALFQGQRCQSNRKLQIVFKFLSTAVKSCMVATHFNDQAQYTLCDWCVFKWHNTIFVIFHLNVSKLSICSSCFSGDKLMRTISTHYGQDQSTAAQRAETTVAECFSTSCIWAHFSDKFPHYAWTAMSAHSDFVWSRLCACLSVTYYLNFWLSDCGLLRATAVVRGWNRPE